MAEGSKSKSLDPSAPDSQDGGAGGKRRRLIGWVLVPTLVLGGLFTAGVHVGARYPDMLLTRGVLWLTNAEASRAPPAADKAEELGELVFGEAQQVGLEPGEPFELAFDWPLPARAIVEEWAQKKDTSAKLRYELEVEPGAEQLLVHQRDVQLVEVEGQPIENHPNRAELEDQLSRMLVLPSLIVSPEGAYIGVDDMDAYLDRSLEFVDPADREVLGEGIRSPEMMAMMEQTIGESWLAWVELWVGLEVSADRELQAELDGEYRLVALDGETIRLEYRFEREFEANEIGLVISSIASAAGDDSGKAEDALKGVRGGKVLVTSATLRRDTLLPIECTRQIDMWLEAPGEPRETRREIHRYSFDWQ